MDRKRKTTELAPDLANLRIGHKLREKIGRAIEVIYDACETDIHNNNSKSEIILKTLTTNGNTVKAAGENINRGGIIINLMLSIPVTEKFERSEDPKDVMIKFDESLKHSSVTLKVQFECKILEGENASSKFPKKGLLRYTSSIQGRYSYKILEFDCIYDSTNMIMLKGGEKFIYLTAKFTINTKPPLD